MKLAIMQPYFFPYIGYFQLIKAVDTFIIYDDVNYIKGGWLNRNRILSEKGWRWLTLKLSKASVHNLINKTEIWDDPTNKQQIVDILKITYLKTPYYSEVMPIIQKIVLNPELNLAKYLADGLNILLKYLNIQTKIMISSKIKKNNHLKGQDKVIEICQKLSADEYINAQGGTSLYLKKDFNEKGITLRFIKSKPIQYQQFTNEFIPELSIIDIMMFNSKQKISDLLSEYEMFQ